jgi:hypothetical protein
MVLLLSWMGMVLPQGTTAACEVETGGSRKDEPLIIRLPPSCTPLEREARAVDGSTILKAAARGRAVNLVGVIVRGDLILDPLTVQADSLTDKAGSEQRTTANFRNVGEHRSVREAITIRDSVVRGAVRHRSATGRLQFEGPLDFRRTVFKDGVDLSRSDFQQQVLLSGATFEKEAFFVQGRFAQGLECKETKFGPHTRFHRSTFGGPVDCADALFDGLAELLEVSFEESVSFERARFGLGTGFSGSRFKRRSTFDDAIFSREAFFSFSVFEGEVSFAGTQFLGRTDFSDAEFKRPDNLAKARFDQPPGFMRTKRNAQTQEAELESSPAAQYAVTILCLIVAAMLVGYALRLK